MTTPPRSGLLDAIERIGNWLPDPTSLFLLGTVVVILLSWLAVAGDWVVQPSTVTSGRAIKSTPSSTKPAPPVDGAMVISASPANTKMRSKVARAKVEFPPVAGKGKVQVPMVFSIGLSSMAISTEPPPAEAYSNSMS